MNNQNYLAHHGVLGQRWGVRRYQNEDGSWKKRAGNVAKAAVIGYAAGKFGMGGVAKRVAKTAIKNGVKVARSVKPIKTVKHSKIRAKQLATKNANRPLAKLSTSSKNAGKQYLSGARKTNSSLTKKMVANNKKAFKKTFNKQNAQLVKNSIKKTFEKNKNRRFGLSTSVKNISKSIDRMDKKILDKHMNRTIKDIRYWEYEYK